MIRAASRYIRISPRKVRLVADLIKGQPVEDAIDLLQFTRRSGARELRKLLQSAVANGEQRGGVTVEGLVVHRVTVNPGPVLKRYRPRSMGRVNMIRKRTSHISVELKQNQEG